MKISGEDTMTECNREEGSALIVVLGLFALISLLTLSIVSFSKVTDRLSKIASDREKAAYWAESALDRAIWLLRNDIVKHPTRTLGAEQDEDEEIERFLADGVTHIFTNDEENEIKVTILDAVTGIDISGSRPSRYLQRPQSYFDDDRDTFERYKLFLNSVTDYVDTNDFTHINGGFEREDYAAIGMAPLPRNNIMEYKYEILWIPGFSEFFSIDQYGRLPSIRIIAPQGLRQLRGSNNFFSADNDQIKLTTGFDDDQMQQVIDARNGWTNSQIPLSESLGPDLLSRLQQNYSFRESGFYTFVIEASPGEGFASRIFTCSLQITNNLTTTNEISFYEWRFLR